MAALIFVVLPFVYSGATVDPELSLRFLILSLFLGLLSLYLAVNAVAIDGSLLRSLATRKEIIFFVLLILLSAFSLSRSINTGDGLYALSRLITMGILWIVLILIQDKNRKVFYVLIPFVNFAVLIFSIYGVSQMVLAHQEASAELLTLFNPRNITSTLGNNGYYSATMLLSMPFSICGSLRFRGWLKYTSLASLLLALLTIIMLQSMNVILALAFSAGVSICLMMIFPGNLVLVTQIRKAKWKVFFIAIVVIFISTIVFWKSGGFITVNEKLSLGRMYLSHPDTMNVNSEINDNSVFERLLLWRNSLELVREHPFFGCGLADWKVEMPKYRVTGNALLNQGTVRFDHPDNDYMLIASETGIIGLMVYLFVFFFVLKNIIHTLRFSADEDQRLLSLLLFFGVLSFMLMSLFENPKERFFPMVLLMTLFASVENNSPIIQGRKSNHSNLSRIVFSLFFIIMSGTAIVFFKRYSGETYLKNAILAQEEQQWTAMKVNITKARSKGLSFDLLGTPLEWYMGLANYYSGNTEQSFQFYLEATRKNPYHLQTWNDLGSIYEHEKKHSQAISCYKRALELNPYFPQGILNLTAAYFNAGELDSAYRTIVRHEVNYTDTTYRTFLLAVLRAKVHAVSSEHPDLLQNNQSDSLLLKTFESCRKSDYDFTMTLRK